MRRFNMPTALRVTVTNSKVVCVCVFVYDEMWNHPLRCLGVSWHVCIIQILIPQEYRRGIFVQGIVENYLSNYMNRIFQYYLYP